MDGSDPDDFIYFGSNNNIVYLKPSNGSVHIYRHSNAREDASSLPIVMSRVSMQQCPMDGVNDVVIPAIPALDVVMVDNNNNKKDEQEDLPLTLQMPLIKVGSNDDGTCFCGVASGARSALIKVSGTWFRLKGCGDWDKGFTVRQNHGGWRDIRGCAFEHTAKRELFVTESLKSLMPQSVSCNRAVAYAFYQELPLGPHFVPTCIVERTLGDRRLGTHVLAGLELLLPLLAGDGVSSDAEILAWFPANRPGRQSIQELVPTGELMLDYMLGTVGAGHDRQEKGLAWPHVPRDGSTFANLIATQPPRWSPPETLSEGSRPLQWTREGAKLMDEAGPLWEHSVRDLFKGLAATQRHLGEVLPYLYAKCGEDAGLCLREMHAARFSWGTYQDSMCNKDLDEWHCNAHANNLVWIQHPTKLLAYLDLDMAFSEASFVDFSNGHIGHPDFDHLLWREYVNLAEVMVGADASTGVPRVAHSVTDAHSPRIKAFRTALYDTLISYFCGTYRKDDATTQPLVHDEQLHELAQKVIRLAVIVMGDYVA